MDDGQKSKGWVIKRTMSGIKEKGNKKRHKLYVNQEKDHIGQQKTKV